MKTRVATAAFTIAELLLVMAILCLVAVFTVPAINHLMAGSQLTRSADRIAGALSLARQTAISRNQAAEVRFYQYGDPDVPGETAGNPGTGKFRAFQILAVEESGKANPVAKVETLPGLSIVDANPELSSLLDASRSKTWTAADPQLPLPRVGTSYACRSFRFRPDGSTDLAPTGSWFLTVHHATDPASVPPKFNFVTIQIEPVSGLTSTYRP